MCQGRGLNMNIFRNFRSRIYENMKWCFVESEPYFFVFGIAVLIGVLGFYFLNLNLIADDVYENFALCCVAGVIVLPLIFNKFWPSALDKYKMWYWYVVLIYTLPFFFSFMILMNPASNIWHINGITCLVVLVLFLDISTFCLVLIVGVAAGMSYFAFERISYGPLIPIELQPVLWSYLGPIIYILLFSRKKEKNQQFKLHSMKMVVASIAHELRTPLAAMTMGSQALAKFLPAYRDAYASAKEANLPVSTLLPYQEKNLGELPGVFENISLNANAMITMLLTNLGDNRLNHNLEVCSMARCVQEALDAYPFAPLERNLVHWNNDEDFIFNGHKELTKHVIFNLLKNALYSIAAAGRGKIYISLGLFDRHNNFLSFKDTGLGISRERVRSVFDRFYTDKAHGTGIGLAFCRSVIDGYGGEISCSSQLGEHATFLITLPKIK